MRNECEPGEGCCDIPISGHNLLLLLLELLGRWATLFLGFVGVALISYRALTGPEAYGLAGASLALAASVGASSGSVIVKRMGVREGLLVVTAWQLVLGSLPLLLVSWAVEGEAHINWSAQFLAVLLFLALVGTAFANAAWY